MLDLLVTTRSHVVFTFPYCIGHSASKHAGRSRRDIWRGTVSVFAIFDSRSALLKAQGQRPLSSRPTAASKVKDALLVTKRPPLSVGASSVAATNMTGPVTPSGIRSRPSASV